MDAENVPDVVLCHILESDRPITGLPVLRAMARELLALRPALAAAQRERDDFKTKYEFMVLKACDEKLPAYREQAMNLLAAIERAEAAEEREERLSAILDDVHASLSGQGLVVPRVQALVAENVALREAIEWLNQPFQAATTCGPIDPPDGAFVAGWREAWYAIGAQFRAVLASSTVSISNEMKGEQSDA